MHSTPLIAHEMTDRPTGFIAPDLSPVGLELEPLELDDGVYALMVNQMPEDNNGLIVGRDCALVDRFRHYAQRWFTTSKTSPPGLLRTDPLPRQHHVPR